MQLDKKLNIVHVASFLGNIGDYANHQGFYNFFNKYIGEAKFKQIEIRKFYKNRAEMKFDYDFVNLVNKHDMLVLGGGGFFDLKWDYSENGTTMNLSEEIINKIEVPVLINAMGYHEYEDVNSENVVKFKKFLDIISNNKKWFLSVRNDGTYDRLVYRYGKEITEKFIKVPDNAFYYTAKKSDWSDLDKDDCKWIGMNITNDLFNKKFNKDLSVDEFNIVIGEYINNVLKNDSYKLILFPHAHQDVSTIGKVLQNIEDKYKRERIVIAPLVTQEQSIDHVFHLYRLCSCVIGMRFHANVCGIGMGIPTVGLAGHEQIISLYRELDISERCVILDSRNFRSKLDKLVIESINNREKISQSYLKAIDNLQDVGKSYFAKIKEWIINS